MRMLIKEVSEAQSEILFDEMLRATNPGAIITPIIPTMGRLRDDEVAEEDFEAVEDTPAEITGQRAISHMLASAENLDHWSRLFRMFTEDGWSIALMRENTRGEWAKIFEGMMANHHEEVGIDNNYGS